jgi:hypothetical protein
MSHRFLTNMPNAERAIIEAAIGQTGVSLNLLDRPATQDEACDNPAYLPWFAEREGMVALVATGETSAKNYGAFWTAYEALGGKCVWLSTKTYRLSSC